MRARDDAGRQQRHHLDKIVSLGRHVIVLAAPAIRDRPDYAKRVG